jgi:hypothetical protein
MLIANDGNGSGGSAVVIASRDAKDVMRKLVAMQKILSKNKKMNYSSTNLPNSHLAIAQ